MPKNKDLKRLVRARMDKTGESYTTARAQLTKQQNETPEVVPPERYAEVAGMSDGALEAKTGRTWQSWVDALDHAEAESMSHRDIARIVHAKFDIPGW